jgi:hypothetical protein
MFRGICVFSLVLGIGLLIVTTSCSHYANEIQNSQSTYEVSVTIPDTLQGVRKKLHTYLRSRGRIEKEFDSTLQPGRVFIIQPWVRDSSLRYYLLKRDERIRHMSEWKAQWTLETQGAQKTALSLDVLEVIHLGPPSNVKRPEPQEIATGLAKNDWIETPNDTLRAAVEMRRFWTENYLGFPLPPSLSNFKIDDLKGPPLGRRLLTWKPDRIKRETPF